MRQLPLSACAAALLAISSASLVAQQDGDFAGPAAPAAGAEADKIVKAPPAQDAIEVRVSDADLSIPGVALVASGETHSVSLLGPAGGVLGGVFVWHAESRTDFQLVAEGLLFAGSLNIDGDLRAPVEIPVQLSGSLITAMGVVTDGNEIQFGKVCAFLIL
jgi:hypothetical protein